MYRIAEDKTEINEKVMDVKKGSVITKSQENPNQKPKTKGLKSKLRGLVSGKGIAKATKVKRGVKELGKKGCNKIKGLLPGPKKTAKQVSKHHTTPPPRFNTHVYNNESQSVNQRVCFSIQSYS